MKRERRCLIVGIGNPNMGDDAIGIVVAEEMARKRRDVDVEVLFYISFDLMDRMLGYNHVIIVDAAYTGARYGEVIHIPYRKGITTGELKNSHGLGIFQVLETGYVVYGKEMPQRIDLILIETGEIRGFKRGISRGMELSLPHIIGDIEEIISQN